MAVSPKFKNVFLNVLALDGKNVKEIDENGKPLLDLRVVGKSNKVVIPGGVRVPYSSYIVARLKEGSLLPVDAETAKLAGIPFKTQKL
jgi:hypothetical protein